MTHPDPTPHEPNRITGYQTDSLDFVSTGLCQNCETCARDHGYIDEDGETDIDAYNRAVETDEIHDNGSFSWHPCEECNTRFGGDSFTAHGIGKDTRELEHFTICHDCNMQLNGYTIEEIYP